MSKLILHIDLNKFFVRCEEIKNPALINKPVAIGGDGRRGIVSTCSYEARNYGIHSGMPMFQAKMLCKNLIIISGDYKYYELMSREFINVISKYSKRIEQMSIDECFVDVTSSLPKIRAIGLTTWLKGIQKDLFERTKLNCSIGVATTKFLAKMGSDYKKPNGITIIPNSKIEEIIFPLPVGDFFGIGKKTAPKLERAGFKTIGDLYYGIKNNDARLDSFFGSYKDDILANLEGRSSDNVHQFDDDPKSLGMTRTLDYDTNDKSYIERFLSSLIDKVYQEFSHKEMLCKTIQITYKDAECTENGFKSTTSSYSFDEYTKSSTLIKQEGLKLFNKTYKGNTIRLIGFTLKNLKPQHNVSVQMTFDNYEQFEQENKTGNILDDLNRQFRDKKFFRLSELRDKTPKKWLAYDLSINNLLFIIFCWGI